MSIANGHVNGNGKSKADVVKLKHPGGRPTKYKPEYAQKMIEFFESKKVLSEYPIGNVSSKGDAYTTTKLMTADMPTFEDFAWEIGVADHTLQRWSEEKDEKGEILKPEFCAAYTRCKQLQKAWIINAGMKGIAPPAFAIFVAKNVTDMKDKSEVEHNINVTESQERARKRLEEGD